MKFLATFVSLLALSAATFAQMQPNGLDKPILEQKPEPNKVGYYTSPGIIGYRGDHWIGSDHLYNLTESIGVIVELVTLPNQPVPLDKNEIENIVIETLKKGGIKPIALKGESFSPLPYLHVLIMSMPMPNGYIAFVGTRLFEEAALGRIQLAEGIKWQAITWEKQTLVEASSQDFKPHVNQDVRELADEFVVRFKHFEELRQKYGPAGQKKFER